MAIIFSQDALEGITSFIQSGANRGAINRALDFIAVEEAIKGDVQAALDVAKSIPSLNDRQGTLIGICISLLPHNFDKTQLQQVATKILNLAY